MKAYPAYKDSGFGRLGIVPSHWGVYNLKRLTSFNYGNSLSKEIRIDGKIPVYGSNGIVGYHDESITKSPCIIIGRKGSFGKVNYSKTECFPIDTTYYIDETATRNNLRWLYYLLISLRLDAFSKDSAVPGLSREDAYEKRAVYPPLLEQQAIADFLDRKTAQIDTLIEKKQRQIDLLQEEHKALINHAITKGLNPQVTVKDSGVKWLSEIPSHWKVVKTKYLFRLVTEKAPDDNNMELLSLYTEIGVRPRKDLEARGNKASTTDGYWIVKEGDIIINKLLAWMGAVGYSAYDGVTSPAYDILRKTVPLNSKFYHYFFRCGICLPEFKRRSRGIMEMRLRLYFDELGQIPLVYPPESEQNQIVKYLEDLEENVNRTISKITKEIELLQEYRMALISEAVTGKIDVRTAETVHESPTGTM